MQFNGIVLPLRRITKKRAVQALFLVCIVFLLIYFFWNLSLTSNSIDDVCALFPNKWTQQRLLRTVSLLQAVTVTLEQHKLPYSLMAGALLGVKRHGQFIPWDDDVDLFVAPKYDEPMKQALRQQQKLCFENFWGGVKIYFCKDALGTRMRPVYPFVDIFTISPSTCLVPLRCPLYWYGHLKHFESALYSPTVHTKLYNISLRVPRHANVVLRATFGASWSKTCASPMYDHVRGRSVPNANVRVHCRILKYLCDTPLLV